MDNNTFDLNILDELRDMNTLHAYHDSASSKGCPLTVAYCHDVLKLDHPLRTMDALNVLGFNVELEPEIVHEDTFASIFHKQRILQ